MRNNIKFSIILLAANFIIYYLYLPLYEPAVSFYAYAQPTSGISTAAQNLNTPKKDIPPAYDQISQENNVGDFLILVDFKIENYPDVSRIILRTNRYFDYINYDLGDQSNCLVLDPTEPVYLNFEKPMFDPAGLMRDVKLAKSIIQEENLPSVLKQGFYPVDYFVFYFPSEENYYIYQRANLLVIDIGAKRLPLPEEFISTFAVSSGKVVRKEEPAAALEKKAQQPKKQQPPDTKAEAIQDAALKGVSQEQAMEMTFKKLRDQVITKSQGLVRAQLPGGKNKLSFRECLEIGTYNYLPLVIAEEDVRLNDMKVDEANRGLFPTATAKYVKTSGKTLGVEFIEETYGMQVEQPVYYGGRLGMIVKQAKINREVAKAKYDKAEADLVSKVTETFYSLVTAQLNLQDQRQLQRDSQEILKLAREKYQEGLTTKLELLNVESQSNQIGYQISSAAKDIEIARVNLLQAMGVDPSREMTADFSMDAKPYDIDINKCLLTAYQNRPELHMNELLQEASEYEERIAKSKDDIKVDFTGFLGESGGAYKTESLNLKKDWYVGVKASKPWLGNTGSYNYTKNRTSPKLGQSTRTEAESHAVEFGILNNLTGYSEKQSARINKLKAENEIIEIEKTINTEVREAYHNYQKAIIQIQNTQDKIAFREEELKVLKSQAELKEALLSQVLEAMVKLKDEKALYNQAIASYKTALANLNKAMGLINYFE